MSGPRLLWRILRTLWRSGLLRLSLPEALGVVRAVWRCGSSYAALAAIAAQRFPERCALHDEEGTLTFAELAAASDALAAALLREHGLAPGALAGLLCRNHRGFVVGLLAASRLGLDVAPLSTDAPAPALERALEGLRPALVLHDGDLEALLLRSAPAQAHRRIDGPLQPRGLPLPRARRTSHLVVLTSGSTGAAKGIRRRPSAGSLLAPVAGLLEGLPLRLHQPAVLAIPLHHGYGLSALALTLAMGAPLVLARRFEIAPLLARLPAEAEPVLVGVPTLLQRWLRARGPSAGARPGVVISGSAPLEAALCTALLEALGPVLFNLYGSTEAGVLSLATPAELCAAPGTVGRLLPGNALRLVDAEGLPVPTGATGRVLVSGPLVLRPGPDGWLDTGDLGRLDAEGRLFVCGRSDAMFVSGGENVYPEETAAALAAHPALLDAAVTVVPDAEFGRRMLAWVVARPEQSVDEAALRGWLRERLERSKVPRKIIVVPGIPRNALGKVDGAALEQLREEVAG